MSTPSAAFRAPGTLWQHTTRRNNDHEGRSRLVRVTSLEADRVLEKPLKEFSLAIKYLLGV